LERFEYVKGEARYKYERKGYLNMFE